MLSLLMTCHPNAVLVLPREWATAFCRPPLPSHVSLVSSPWPLDNHPLSSPSSHTRARACGRDRASNNSCKTGVDRGRMQRLNASSEQGLWQGGCTHRRNHVPVAANRRSTLPDPSLVHTVTKDRYLCGHAEPLQYPRMRQVSVEVPRVGTYAGTAETLRYPWRRNVIVEVGHAKQA